MPHIIAFISKYPPLEGGIAAKTYWLTRGLAARGHRVHIITDNLSVGGQYRYQSDTQHDELLPTLFVHRPDKEMPWHIPEDDERALALLDLAIRVIREYNVEIVDSGYLIPYGIVGHLAKCATGVRHVLRHGGSDIEKFLKKGILGSLLTATISCADAVITDRQHRSLLESMNPASVVQFPYVPDDVFTSETERRRQRRLAAIGKINYYWQHKRLDYVAEIMQHLAGQFECLIVGQGNGIRNFREALDEELRDNLSWQPFIPPWEVPDLLRGLDAIFVLESALPHPVTSNLVFEALWMGIGIITDRENFADAYRDVVATTNDHICVLHQGDSAAAAADQIRAWLERRNSTPPSPLASFQSYLEQNEMVYRDVLIRGSSDSLPTKQSS